MDLDCKSKDYAFIFRNVSENFQLFLLPLGKGCF
jgi:hypothetical protein